VPNSLDSEELPPQGHASIAGNVVADNGDPAAAHKEGFEFDAAFGGGIVIPGGVDDVIVRNRVVRNTVIGIAIAPNPGLEQNVYLATDNTVRDNVVQGSGLVDLAVLLPTADDGNCFSGNTFATSAPANLEQLKPCGGAAGTGDLNAGALDIGKFLETSDNPPGRPYQQTPVPKKQRNMPNASSAQARSAGEPIPVDLADITVPVSAG